MWSSPSTSTCVCDHLRQGPVYDYSMNREVPQVKVYHYRRPEDVGFVKYLSETNMYNYFLYDRYENVYFLYIVPNPNRSETHASKV